MKRFLLLLTIVISSLSLLAATAEAKRFGGGSSIGKQRTMAPQQTAKAPAAAPAPTAAPAAQPAGNRWLGPLAGLAIGAGLGAMFAGGLGGMGGLGGALSGILMAAAAGVAIMFLISLFRKKQQPAMQYAGAGAPYGGQPEYAPQAMSASPAPIAAAGNIPADFPVEAFLRSAKTSFIRLQAANDRKDLDDIREYTTPEMFAEISMQLRERDNTPQKTDVDTVNAELLEVAHENNIAIASVRMSGQLRENNGAPESFDEVWHVQKNLNDDKAVWLLSGIQQIS
jgi:predicted lipid-binding transport protein (Tim44 family)